MDNVVAVLGVAHRGVGELRPTMAVDAAARVEKDLQACHLGGAEAVNSSVARRFHPQIEGGLIGDQGGKLGDPARDAALPREKAVSDARRARETAGGQRLGHRITVVKMMLSRGKLTALGTRPLCRRLGQASA